ncbi:MAG TPA: hypothetical protein VJ455_10355 [Ignavibacteria bacterium]|nr:hypothetical protein [Ignavibacteria bacterium]
MYEKAQEELASQKVFKHRLRNSVFISVFIMVFSLSIGIWGYSYFEDLSLTDSFLNAAMILGGMGPAEPLKHEGAKIFAGFYALFCGVAFLIGMGVVLTPLLHRFLHKFHLEEED